MKKRKIAKRIISMLLIAAMAFVNRIPAAAETGETTKPADITFENGNVVDASAGWNSQGGGLINIYDGYYTNVYFTNDPFIRDSDNWSNFIIETNAPEGCQGYTLRADNFGWSYGDGQQPTLTSTCSDWNFNWEKFQDFCKSDVIVSAFKYDENNLKFYIQFSEGDTMTYTLNYPAGIPADLGFYVGADGGKVTQNKITFTETMPNSIESIKLSQSESTLTNTHITSGDEVIAVEQASLDLSATLSPVGGESLYFKDIVWDLSDSDKATLISNEDGTVTVKLADTVKENDTVTVTATAVDGSKVSSSCVITAKIEEKEDENPVTSISVDDQTLSGTFMKNADNEYEFTGDSVEIVPTIEPENPTTKAFTLTSEDPSIVAIDDNKIVPVGEGSATVTIKSKSASKTDSFNVIVTNNNTMNLSAGSSWGSDQIKTYNSGFIKLTGDFDILYEFTNKSKDTTNAWFNFFFTLARGAKYQILRADNYVVDSSNSLFGVATWTGGGAGDDDWATFRSDMADADVMIRAFRKDSTITVCYCIKSNQNDNIYYTRAVMNADDDDLYATISGENVDITDVSLSENVDSFEMPCSADNVTLSNDFKNIKIFDSVNFTVTPSLGYSVTKVSYGGNTLTADTNGTYTIPFVTGETDGLEVEIEKNTYLITYVVDGVEQSDKVEFTIDEVSSDGTVALKDVGTLNGWYTDAKDKTNKISAFSASEYMTEDGITVYGYNPYTITMDESNPTTFDHGTIEELDTTKSYYMGDTVTIVTKPEEGYTASIKAMYMVGETETELEIIKDSGNDGVEYATFTMPAANVTITYGEFTTIDKSGLEAAIEAAKTIYETGNEDGIYISDSWDDFKDAYENAQSALDATTQGAIDEAERDLKAAQAGLVYVYSIALDKTEETMKVGDTLTITATVTTAGEDKSVIWISSDDAKATVEGGVVSALAEGEVTITATAADGTTFATCKITITSASIKVTGITLDKTTATLKVGETVKLTATVTPNDATDPSYTWTSSKSEVVTVEDGTVKAIAVGSATITVTTTDGKKTATCEVTVTAATSSDDSSNDGDDSSDDGDDSSNDGDDSSNDSSDIQNPPSQDDNSSSSDSNNNDTGNSSNTNTNGTTGGTSNTGTTGSNSNTNNNIGSGTTTLKKATITAKNGKKKVSSVTVKKGKKATLKITTTSKGKLSLSKLTKKKKKIASVTLKSGKLTIKGKKKGTITVTITSAKTKTYKKATKKIKIKVKK